ncbi:MAG: nucleotidyl transferase AbiEii/AbiGii toxin family protein [Massilibacteroides sp.]|nr:nucleotidyl transferase AbiEii/AbiGii toxin family protein [Massilibacteroides sp.]MDD4660674.1 nucleotidyl transferase AbiEii/AbiGii toxin family protein [Massilibacteroides sp.]
MNKSLVDRTKKVIESISKMDSIKPYLLVGGTALSLQIENRLSEDLDFMRWQQFSGERMDIDLKTITRELRSEHVIDRTNILDSNQIELFIDGGVKLSFYAPERKAPPLNKVHFLNNLYLADTSTIASLKMEVMQRRSNFRDYYDLYCILKEKTTEEIIQIIDDSLKYSGHQMKSKNLLGKLGNYERFQKDEIFKQLEPKYDISSKEIAEFMDKKVKTAYQNK